MSSVGELIKQGVYHKNQKPGILFGKQV